MKSAAAVDLTGDQGEGGAKAGHVGDQGVELAVFAARVDLWRQLGQQAGIETAATEAAIALAGVDGDEVRGDAAVQDLAGQVGRGFAQ